jgi:hypothetical protein
MGDKGTLDNMRIVGRLICGLRLDESGKWICSCGHIMDFLSVALIHMFNHSKMEMRMNRRFTDLIPSVSDAEKTEYQYVLRESITQQFGLPFEARVYRRLQRSK